MAKDILQGLTTKEEFHHAIRLIISCESTLNCGCEFDEMQAENLYYQCKQYIEAFKTRTH